MDYFDKDHNYIVQDLQNEDEYQVGFVHCDEDVFLELVNKIADENKELKHNNKMLSMKMSEVYTKYCLLKEFSEDTNPNDAVKRVLSELMQITKEYR